jgi:hypothetical protein
MILPSISLLLVPRLCLRLFPVTMGPNSIFNSSALQFPLYGHFQNFEKGVTECCHVGSENLLSYTKCEIRLTEIGLSTLKASMEYRSCIEWKTIVKEKCSSNSLALIYKVVGALVKHTYRYQPIRRMLCEGSCTEACQLRHFQLHLHLTAKTPSKIPAEPPRP